MPSYNERIQELHAELAEEIADSVRTADCHAVVQVLDEVAFILGLMIEEVETENLMGALVQVEKAEEIGSVLDNPPFTGKLTRVIQNAIADAEGAL